MHVDLGILSSAPPPLSHLPRSLNAGSFSTLYQNICTHVWACTHTHIHTHTHTHTQREASCLEVHTLPIISCIHFLLFFFLAALCCLRDFSSQTRDHPSYVSCSGSSKSNHWPTREIPSSILFGHPFAKCHVVGLNLQDNLSGLSPYSALDAGSLSPPASLEANRWAQDQKKAVMKVCWSC